MPLETKTVNTCGAAAWLITGLTRLSIIAYAGLAAWCVFETRELVKDDDAIVVNEGNDKITLSLGLCLPKHALAADLGWETDNDGDAPDYRCASMHYLVNAACLVLMFAALGGLAFVGVDLVSRCRPTSGGRCGWNRSTTLGLGIGVMLSLIPAGLTAAALQAQANEWKNVVQDWMDDVANNEQVDVSVELGVSTWIWRATAIVAGVAAVMILVDGLVFTCCTKTIVLNQEEEDYRQAQQAMEDQSKALEEATQSQTMSPSVYSSTQRTQRQSTTSSSEEDEEYALDYEGPSIVQTPVSSESPPWATPSP